MPEKIEDRVYEALKIPRRIRLTVWDEALQIHKRHPGFLVQTWAYTREYGFTCPCSGTKQEWKVDVGCLKEMVPDALEAVRVLYEHHSKFGQKKVRRERARAEVRARSLLHRYLTKEQRAELRATASFTTTGKDGRTYQVTKDKGILVEHEGVPYSLCVHPRDWVPTLDTMLAQKVMLETDPETLLRIANATNLSTHESVGKGSVLLGEPQPPRAKRAPLVELTDEQLENPREWVETRTV